MRSWVKSVAGLLLGSALSFGTPNVTMATAAGATSIAIPAHVAGDIIVIFAYRITFSTPPSLPAGWNNLQAPTGSNNNSSRLAYKQAASSSEVSGTWTNASGLVVAVVHKSGGGLGVGGSANVTTANGTVLNYPGVTMTDTSGHSIILAFGGRGTASAGVANPPAGMTNDTSGSSAGLTLAGHHSGSQTSWGSQAVNVTSSAVGGASCVEITGAV